MEQLIQIGVELAIEQTLSHFTDNVADQTEQQIRKSGPALYRPLVKTLVEKILAGQDRAELEQACRDFGLHPDAIGPLVDRVLANCHRDLELRLFRWSVGLTASLWISPLLAALWIGLFLLISGNSDVEAAIWQPLSLAVLGLLGLPMLLGFWGCKVFFPKWYEIHTALLRNSAGLSECKTTQTLAIWLGPFGGHYWYLGHRGYSQRGGPGAIIGSILMIGTGIPALVSWSTAWKLSRMSDDEFERWALRVNAEKASTWGWLARIKQKSPPTATGILIVLRVGLLLMGLCAGIFLASSFLVIFSGGIRNFLVGLMMLTTSAGVLWGVWQGWRICSAQAGSL